MWPSLILLAFKKFEFKKLELRRPGEKADDRPGKEYGD